MDGGRERRCNACLLAGQHDLPAVQAAEGHYRQALALATELGMRPIEAHGHLGLGTLYTKIGQQEQARAELPAMVELYRAMEMMLWLPLAEAALAQAGEYRDGSHEISCDAPGYFLASLGSG